VLRSFELFVAARYLRAKRSQRVVSVITVISILGAGVGVMALILALAVNNGFRNSLQRSLLGATPHVALLEKDPSSGITAWRPLAARLAALPNVASVAPSLYGKVFLSGTLQSAEATLKGLPPESRGEVARHLRQGSLEALDAGARYPGIILGAHLSRHTGLTLNSVATLVSPQGELTPFGARPARFQFRVVGVFESGFYDLDNTFAFVSLAQAQRIFQLGDTVNAIELRLTEPNLAHETARAAEAAAGAAYGATTWMDQNRQLLSALRLERAVSIITIGLIQLVAAFNILTALVLTVLEKRREIAILMSLGARRHQIRTIFLAQGLLIGAAGVVLGLAAGYSLAHLADAGRWIPLDQEIYALSYVPFEPRWIDGVWVTLVALAVSALAALHPGQSAARIVPVETLRYE
jgi:lipoprotein-releasing system permease protein